jgi:hypothetical protein
MAGYEATVCCGADEAWKAIVAYLTNLTDSARS